MSENLTVELAAELTALDIDRLTPRDIQQVQKLVLDHIVVAMAGSVQLWGRMLTVCAERHGAVPAAAGQLQAPCGETSVARPKSRL